MSIVIYPDCRVFFVNPFAPTVAFSQLSSNICCPRDCVPRHNGETASLGISEVPPLCRETQSLGHQMLERWEPMG